MQTTNYAVNQQGLEEIREFLEANHKRGADLYSTEHSGTRTQLEMLHAWAAEAEFQLGEGNPACIEIISFDSIHGYTQEFTISADGLDSETVEIDE